MYARARIVVVFCGAADLRGCRLALGIAEGAWDAGAEVRVRCVQRLVPPAEMLMTPAWVEALGETEGVPTASAGDLAWADAVCIGAPDHSRDARAQLASLLHDVGPVRGCIIVTSSGGDSASLGGDPRLTDGPTDRLDAPSADELDAAHEKGRRIAEATLALLTGYPPLAIAS